MALFARGTTFQEHFFLTGAIATYSLNSYVGGFKEIGFGARVGYVSLTQGSDGSSGNTVIALYKLSSGGSETLMVTASLAQGGGANARVTASTFTTEALRIVNETDRIGIKISASQAGSPQNISFTVKFS